jgi:CBS domain-containing protein
VLASGVVRSILSEDPARGVVIAQDLLAPNMPVLRVSDGIDRALELLALQQVDALPVVGDDGNFVAILDQRAILTAYRRRLDELRSVEH